MTRARPARTGSPRPSTAPAGRAALMPYLMGGFPDVETSVAIAIAYADNGADLIELGVPFSDPLADGPVIHAAATQALANGARSTPCSRPARGSPSTSRSCSCVYANPILARGPERFAAELARARDQRPDRPRPPARGVRAASSPRATRTALRSSRSSHRPRQTLV